MHRVQYIKPDFAEDAFEETATYYARYRVPYPKVLIDDLLDRAGNSGTGRLLDLACGPGRLAIPLSPSFSEVWAIDLEPEMVEVGKNDAGLRNVTNIKWMVGKAEELEAEPASFQLITIGEAFHRLNQRHICERALQWLSPGCCLAIAGCYNITRGSEPWQRVVAGVVNEWRNRVPAPVERPARPRPGSGPGHNRRVLRDMGFDDVESYSFTFPYVWTVESIVGNLFSSSRCSKKALGHDAEAFQADVRDCTTHTRFQRTIPRRHAIWVHAGKAARRAMNTRRLVLLDIGGVIPEKYRDAVLEFLEKMLGLKTVLYKSGMYSILEP